MGVLYHDSFINSVWRYKLIIVFSTLALIVFLTSRRATEGTIFKQSYPLLPVDILKDTEFVEKNFDTIDHDDPKLIRYVRSRYLIPPSSSKDLYHFNYPGKDIRTDHGKWVRNYLRDMRGGTFIEAGANEGESHSHTLELEMELDWSGILIECNPTVTPYLRTKKRKAWVAGVCISTTPHPGVFNFSNPKDWTYSGRFGAAWNLPVPTNWTYFDVESVPLYTIIAAAGYKTIDFFSFDVEGVEMEILQNFPFDKVTIKLMIVEVQFIDAEKRISLEKFLNKNGLFIVEKQTLDHIYAHRSLTDFIGK